MAWTLLCQRHVPAFLRSASSKQTFIMQSWTQKMFSSHNLHNRTPKFALLNSLSDLQCPRMSMCFLRNSSQKLPIFGIVRTFSSSPGKLSPSGGSGHLQDSNKTGLIYIVAVFIFMIGGAYAGVPLYKVFCQVSLLHL